MIPARERERIRADIEALLPESATVERTTRSTDAYGAVRETTTVVGTVRARRAPIRDALALVAQRVADVATTVVTVPAVAPVFVGDVLAFADGSRYRVTGFVGPDVLGLVKRLAVQEV